MSFLKLAKSVLAFMLTCLFSLALTQIIHHFPAKRSGFSSEEARAHLSKRVRFNGNCPNCPVKNERTTGRTIFFEDWRGEYMMAIDWDVSFRGRHEVIFCDKETYDREIVEVGPSED